MKTLTVYCDKDLVLRWNEWPEEPEDKSSGEMQETELRNEYKKTLADYQAAIELAKRESKPFEDQKSIHALIRGYINDHILLWGLKPDTFYSFPFEGEVEVEELCDKGSCASSGSCYAEGLSFETCAANKVARLVPSEPEESQEELFRDVFQRLYDCLERGHGSLKSILNDFLITRKHP